MSALELHAPQVRLSDERVVAEEGFHEGDFEKIDDKMHPLFGPLEQQLLMQRNHSHRGLRSFHTPSSTQFSYASCVSSFQSRRLLNMLMNFFLDVLNAILTKQCWRYHLFFEKVKKINWTKSHWITTNCVPDSNDEHKFGERERAPHEYPIANVLGLRAAHLGSPSFGPSHYNTMDKRTQRLKLRPLSCLKLI